MPRINQKACFSTAFASSPADEILQPAPHNNENFKIYKINKDRYRKQAIFLK